jgi:hypothetical protein
MQGANAHMRVFVSGYDVQNHDQLTHAGKQAGFENIGRDGSLLSQRCQAVASCFWSDRRKNRNFFRKKSQAVGPRSLTAGPETLQDSRWSEGDRVSGCGSMVNG